MTENTDQSQSLFEELSAMKKPQLIEYANLTYGLAVNANHNKTDIINGIMSAHMKFRGNTNVALDTGQELRPGQAKIHISKTELNKRGHPVIVGLNGVMASIPVGQPVIVPEAYVEILRNAMRTEYELDVGTNELVPREVPSYPFNLISRG